MTLPQDDAIRVLLVDDDPTVIRAYVGVLTQHGAIVETASNGKKAVERVRARSFDVIVSDISMPEMSGLELLKAVRAHDPDVPMILMTGAPSLESTANAIKYGVYRYLEKPVGADELWEVIARGARLHRLARVKR